MGNMSEKTGQKNEKDTDRVPEDSRENPYAHLGILGDLLWEWDQLFEERKKQKQERRKSKVE